MPTVQFSMTPITGQLEELNIFSPMDYGAVGDNVANDKVAVQACINAAAGVGVVLLDRMYLCTSTVTIPSYSTIVGTGWKAGLRFNWTLAAGQGGSVYISNSDPVNGNVQISLRNFTLEGANPDGLPTVVSPTKVSGLLLRRGNSVEIRGMRFYRMVAISMAIQGVSYATITDNLVYQGGRDGIACRAFDGTPATDVVIANNVVREVGDDGIAISAEGDLGFGPVQPTRITIANNTVFGGIGANSNGSGRGIFIFGGIDIAVTGNSVSDTYNTAISLTGDDTTGLFSEQISIVGNVVRRSAAIGGAGESPRAGILVRGPAKDIIVADNIVRETYKASIRVDDNSQATRPVTNVEIVNNQVIDGATSGIVTDFGIYITAGTNGTLDRIRVAGNRVYNNNGGGIRQQRATNVTIENNICINNGNSQASGTDTNAAGIGLSGEGADPTAIVRGNRCYDTRGGGAKQTYGVVFVTTAGPLADATVEGNVLYGNQTASLQVNSSPTLLVRRNNRLSSGAVHGQAVLVGGTVTVNTAEVIAADSIALTRVVTGGTVGHLTVGTIVAGTSFVINSSSGTDTSTVFWEIVH